MTLRAQIKIKNGLKRRELGLGFRLVGFRQHLFPDGRGTQGVAVQMHEPGGVGGNIGALQRSSKQLQSEGAGAAEADGEFTKKCIHNGRGVVTFLSRLFCLPSSMKDTECRWVWLHEIFLLEKNDHDYGGF